MTDTGVHETDKQSGAWQATTRIRRHTNTNASTNTNTDTNTDTKTKINTKTNTILRLIRVGRLAGHNKDEQIYLFESRDKA